MRRVLVHVLAFGASYSIADAAKTHATPLWKYDRPEHARRLSEGKPALCPARRLFNSIQFKKKTDWGDFRGQGVVGGTSTPLTRTGYKELVTAG